MPGLVGTRHREIRRGVLGGWKANSAKTAARLLSAAMLVVLTASCGSKETPQVELFSVKGVIIGADAQPLTSGGMIEFQSTDDRAQRSTAAIDEQGRFELSTLTGNVKSPGARPGAYEVTVYPKAAGFVEPRSGTEKVVIAAQENNLTIKLGPPKP